jgi:hypothetical protein
MKDLLSAPIDILVWDSDEVKHHFEEIKPQLPEVLQIKLWPAGHLSFRPKWKERVWATEWLIQDEKNLIANSKQEAEDLTTQLNTELAELSALSWWIVLGEDKDDDVAIAEANRVRLEAIGAIDEFLQ